MKILKALAAAAAALVLAAAPAQAQAQKLEKTSLTLGVGGKSALYYLPLTIAERLGYFKDAGLDVTINDFAGGSQSLQALVGGSVDLVAGAYEHTIRMQAKNQDIRAIIELGRFPGMVLGVKADRADKIKSAADLKGAKVGVTAPNSSTNFFVNYMIAKAGGNPKDTSFIGVGTGLSAVAAIQKGELDAIVNIDPVISKLEADNSIKILADARTEAGTRAIFGGSNPAAVAYVKNDFIEKNPATTQAMVGAFYKALKWLEKASAEDIVNTVPEAYWLGDKDLYLRAVKASREMYSKTGVIPPEGMKSAYDMLKQFDAELAASNVDLGKTFNDTFIKKAAAGT
jgi:NitT/TauT family transport system substrate-binding protein